MPPDGDGILAAFCPALDGRLAVPLEILHRALVLLRGFSRSERAEVPAFAGFRIFLARIEPVLAGFQFSNHGAITLITASVSFASSSGVIVYAGVR